jgi:DNA-directed RNA polymerase beta subunit
MVIVSRTNGVVSYVDANRIRIKVADEDKEIFGKSEIEYEIQKYQRSNQDTCLNQRPLVYQGEQVVPGRSSPMVPPPKEEKSPSARIFSSPICPGKAITTKTRF